MELEDLQNVLNELGLINEKQEKRIRSYETGAQNLTMAYVIFQGLILLSVSLNNGSSRPNQCQHWWIPFTISLLCSTIFFISFIDYVTRFYNTQYHLDLNYMEQQIIYKQIHHKSTKPSSSSSDDNDDHHSIKMKESFDEILIEPDMVQLLKRKVYITVILLALIGFAVVVLFACGSFLCGDDGSSSQGLVTLRLHDGKL